LRLGALDCLYPIVPEEREKERKREREKERKRERE